jgi:hypothetical protein
MTTTGVIREVWDRAVASQPAPDRSTVVITAAVGIALVVVPVAWHYSRHVVTITHEAGHGLAALLSGRRLAGIRLHSDTSGLTVSRGRLRGPGMVATAAAGYLATGLLGLGAAAVLASGHSVGLLWLLLVQIRNWFGLWSILVAGAVVFGISWWGSVAVQTGFAYVVTWFLLISAPRPVLELQQSRHRGQAGDSDADLLARLTVIPGIAWVGLFLVATMATLVLGARWLV